QGTDWIAIVWAVVSGKLAPCSAQLAVLIQHGSNQAALTKHRLVGYRPDRPISIRLLRSNFWGLLLNLNRNQNHILLFVSLHLSSAFWRSVERHFPSVKLVKRPAEKIARSGVQKPCGSRMLGATRRGAS